MKGSKGTGIRTLLRGNGGLLACSFVVSGLTNVQAQAFFAAHAAALKEQWLALSLLGGTFASIGAVWLCQRKGFFGAPRFVGSALVVALCVGCAWAFRVQTLWLYAVFHMLLRAIANYLTQEIDRTAAGRTPAALRARNDQVGSGLRFVGMLLGPLWLGAASLTGSATSIVLVLLAVLALGSVTLLPPGGSAAVFRSGTAKIPRNQRSIWFAGVLIYGSYYLLAASTVYLLRDLGRAGTTKLASQLIASVYGTAILSTVVIGASMNRGLGLRWMRIAPAIMVACAIGLGVAHRTALGTAILFGATVLLGLAFALFMLAFRDHVSARAALGEEAWIGAFNNLGNSSALVGFGALAVLALFQPGGSVGFPLRLGLGLCALSATALALLRQVSQARTA